MKKNKVLLMFILFGLSKINAQNPNETGTCGFDIVNYLPVNSNKNRISSTAFSPSAIVTCGNIKVYSEDLQF